MLMVKVRPDVALAFNYFVMIMERLCRVSHDNPMQEECTQLLVPVVWGWGVGGQWVQEAVSEEAGWLSLRRW